MIDKVLKRRDRIAEDKGMRASWHLVDSSEMFGKAEEVVKPEAQAEKTTKEVEAA